MTTMDANAFPDRPLSVREVLALREKVGAFEHTAPLVGLAPREGGQETDSKAVVGFYVGLGQGAHLLGFDSETESWESVTIVPPEGVGEPASMAPAMEELMTWLEDRHEGAPLITYDRKSARAN